MEAFLEPLGPPNSRVSGTDAPGGLRVAVKAVTNGRSGKRLGGNFWRAQIGRCAVGEEAGTLITPIAPPPPPPLKRQPGKRHLITP